MLVALSDWTGDTRMLPVDSADRPTIEFEQRSGQVIAKYARAVSRPARFAVARPRPSPAGRLARLSDDVRISDVEDCFICPRAARQRKVSLVLLTRRKGQCAPWFVFAYSP